MMSWSEIARREAPKVAINAAVDTAADSIRSGQIDTGSVAISFTKNVVKNGISDAMGQLDAPSEHGENLQKSDVKLVGKSRPGLYNPPEMSLCDVTSPDEMDAGAGEKSDAPEKKGGSYKEVKKTSDGATHEVHHVPADSASPLERDDGPAIKMEKEDHRQTASCGSSKEAREYCAKQREFIEQGKFREALQMDIDDIHEKFGDKYDDAIAEMLEYVDKLEQEGKING